jgi:hypothetical protein
LAGKSNLAYMTRSRIDLRDEQASRNGRGFQQPPPFQFPPILRFESRAAQISERIRITAF